MMAGWLRGARAWLAELRRRRRAWRRRISFTSGGYAFTLGTFAVGFAAMNTGNNLLYLLLGSMLGFLMVSFWLSEQAVRGLEVRRRPPHPVSVGQEIRLVYEVTNAKRVLPSLAVEIGERGLAATAFVAHVAPGGQATARSTHSFVRRGTYPLGVVTLSTSFPFGLFRKERYLHLPGEIVVWPRTDRRVRDTRAGGGRLPRAGLAVRGIASTRGDYRSLRAYRPGDDPRDIHWRSSARSPGPMVREYERDGAETCWICLDTRGEPGDAAEVAVEVAAALLARAAAGHRPFGLAAGAAVLDVGEGSAHLERALDVLARSDFSPTEPAPRPPVPPEACVLVGLRASPGFGDVLTVRADAGAPSAHGAGAAV
ncbi:MAG TPA: DUF58 domain-containing protein [Longimicrobiales bacterium]|nr:DUF58 domain-containing protein [Longimicrobiales bacterium]